MYMSQSRAEHIGHKLINMFYSQLNIKQVDYDYYQLDNIITITFVDNIEFNIDIYNSNNNMIRVFIFDKWTDNWVHVDSIHWRHVFTFDELEHQLYYIAQWIIDYFYKRITNANFPYNYIIY
ncbi:MAG TPA: hypothetical protein VLG50_07810 [Candidatus Saccharimonadales bacterium]|nr:hypothetical protein [Candidatus Saccharimonadales bacterium]